MTNTAGGREQIDATRLRGGMQVYDAGDELVGSLERFDDASITVRGRRYVLAAIDRIEGDRVYLITGAAPMGTAERGTAPMAEEVRPTGAATTTAAATTAAAAGAAGAAATAREQVIDKEGQTRVPVTEERLEVEKRPTELGAVEIRKTVEQEQQTVPVELEREEVHVEQVKVPERPAGEEAFQEGTVRVPVRGEEAVTRKDTVVTGEVVVDKERTTEQQEVSGTVRRERVEVDEGTTAAAGAAAAAGTAPAARTPATSETTRTAATGTAAGSGFRTLTEGAEVVGSDHSRVGRVKEVRTDDFLVDRSGQRDVYVPFAAVADATEGRIRLNVRAGEVDDQGWPKPPLF